MVQQQEVANQLRRVKADFHLWGRGEVRELHHVLLPGENIQQAIMGRYNGGFAMLCATDQRLLLVDKKPFYLTLEDIRYDMLSELDYQHQLLDATIHLQTINKQLRFTSMNRKNMRELSSYVQQRVSELRQHGNASSDQPDLTPTKTATPKPPVIGAQSSQSDAATASHTWWRPTLGEYVVATQLDISKQATQPLTNVKRTFWAPMNRNGGNHPYASTPLILRRRVSRYYPASR